MLETETDFLLSGPHHPPCQLQGWGQPSAAGKAGVSAQTPGRKVGGVPVVTVHKSWAIASRAEAGVSEGRGSWPPCGHAPWI